MPNECLSKWPDVQMIANQFDEIFSPEVGSEALGLCFMDIICATLSLRSVVLDDSNMLASYKLCQGLNSMSNVLERKVKNKTVIVDVIRQLFANSPRSEVSLSQILVELSVKNDAILRLSDKFGVETVALSLPVSVAGGGAAATATATSNELQSLLHEVELEVGTFLKYQCGLLDPVDPINPNHRQLSMIFHAGEMPLQLRPAYRLCHALLGAQLDNASLTRRPTGVSFPPESGVTVPPGPNGLGIRISADRLNALYESATVYLNEALGWSVNEYLNYLDSACPQNMRWSELGFYMNRAVGVCIAQQIDLLVSHFKDKNGHATAVEKEKIDETKPPILLVSVPALNFSYGLGKVIQQNEALVKESLRIMYRTIFYATIDKGYTHIAMPAIGLGAFNGNPYVYFDVLVAVAKEFPQLQILYHPAEHHQLFSSLPKPVNLVQVTKDIVFVADSLCSRGYKCALVNASDVDVISGVYDVGEYWKTCTKDRGFAFEEYVSMISTAVLGGYGMHPEPFRSPQLIPGSSTEYCRLLAMSTFRGIRDIQNEGQYFLFNFDSIGDCYIRRRADGFEILLPDQNRYFIAHLEIHSHGLWRDRVNRAHFYVQLNNEWLNAEDFGRHRDIVAAIRMHLSNNELLMTVTLAQVPVSALPVSITFSDATVQLRP